MLGKRRTTKRVPVKKPVMKVSEMNDNQARVLAMLVDTEGTICPFKRESGYHTPHIAVEMVSILPLLMSKVWGGRVQKSKNRKGRLTYRWTVAEYALSEDLLKKIEPFLIVKKEQANLALNMLDILKVKNEGWKEELNLRAEHIRKLNDAKDPPDYDTMQIDISTLEELLGLLSVKDIDEETFLRFWYS